MPCCDVAREALAAVERARRAEAETDRLHRWIADGCPPPPPVRPWWLPRSPYRKDSPWET